MTSLRIDHITKRFDAALALDDVNLQIAAGELFFLLGPSGCGKTTLLRVIAGLYQPDDGRIFFNDRDVTALGTDQRNAVMCFQSYALWPHMTVHQNVAFGLEVRKTPAAEASRRIAETLKLVQLEDYASRKPNQLSGGQQQRVALARALAVNPDCLLLDEPLSNLDAKLRHEMRSEIRRICKSAGTTTIYVTHDQKEALSIADRIAVLKAGKLQQVGSPAEVYHAPVNSFVAEFMGQTNLLPAKPSGGGAYDTPAGRILAASTTDGVTMLSIRPEQIRIARSDSPNRLTGKVIESTFLGESTEIVLAVGNQKIRMTTSPMTNIPENLNIEFDPSSVVPLRE